MRYRFLPALLFLGLLLAIMGCSQAPLQVGPSPVPVVPISKPVARKVTDYVEFTGRTDAVRAVDIRARVTGYLANMHFQEGAEIKKGDVLFDIDRAALRGAARASLRPGHACPGPAQAGQVHLCARPRYCIPDARRHQQAAARPGLGRVGGRRGPRPALPRRACRFTS